MWIPERPLPLDADGPTQGSERTAPAAATPDTNPSLPPDFLRKRFTIGRELGRGGMATVYLARDLRLDRLVAIKVLRPGTSALIGVERFLQEIHIAARLQHPHILPVFESGETSGLLWYTMPYVEGESLRERLRREGWLPVPEALRIAREVAEALDYSHRHGVVHRDIKPENILLEERHAVLADFGVARPVSRAAEAVPGTVVEGYITPVSITEPGLIFGSIPYMSPEQALGEGTVDGRADIYSLGGVLYEMLTGSPPFKAATPQALLARRLSEPAPHVSAAREGVGEALDAVVRKALARLPEDRYRTGGEFAAALAQAGAHEAPQEDVAPAAPPVGVEAPRNEVGSRRLSRRRASLATLVMATLAGLVIGGGLAQLRRAARRPTADPNGVALMPFVVRGPRELGYLEEGMVDLLKVNLGGSGVMRVVSPRASLALAARRGAERAAEDPAVARRIAVELEANRFIMGSVIGLGSRVRLTAVLYPVSPADRDTIEASVEGELARVANLVDELTRQLLVGSSRREGARFASLAAATTPSLPALKAYLEGERHWRERETDSALADFHRAVDYDTGFALAYYRIAVAASWSPSAEPGDALAHALAHQEQLPSRDRMLLLAFEARQAGGAVMAESLYRVALQANPDDAEAWFQLGALLVRYGLPAGRPIREARGALQRALTLDPMHPRAPGALSWLDGIEGYHERSVDRMRQLARVDQGEAALLLRTALAFWDRDSAAQDSTIAALRATSDTRAIVFAPDFVAQRAGDLEGGVRVARLLTERSRPLPWRLLGYRVLVNLELAQGHLRQANAALGAIRWLDPIHGSYVEALERLVPFTNMSDDSLASARLAVARAAPQTANDSAWQPYVLGLLSARLGDAPAALHGGAALERRAVVLTEAGFPRASAMSRDLAASIRAALLWRQGQAGDALAVLQRRKPAEWMVTSADVAAQQAGEPDAPFLVQAYERWLYAELLAAVGQRREAVDWYAGLGVMAGEEMAYVAPSRIRMGELYQAMGEADAAVEQYQRVVAMWRRCDPELRPLLQDLQRRIDGLGGDRPPTEAAPRAP